MSRSFATQALSRTATFKTKQSTISTQNTFTFLKLSLPIWSLALKIRWAPLNLGDRLLLRRPRAPPADFSPSWLVDVEDRQGHLHAGKWWWREVVEKLRRTPQGWLLDGVTNLGNGDEEKLLRNWEGRPKATFDLHHLFLRSAAFMTTLLCWIFPKKADEWLRFLLKYYIL